MWKILTAASTALVLTGAPALAGSDMNNMNNAGSSMNDMNNPGSTVGEYGDADTGLGTGTDTGPDNGTDSDLTRGGSDTGFGDSAGDEQFGTFEDEGDDSTLTQDEFGTDSFGTDSGGYDADTDFLQDDEVRQDGEFGQDEEFGADPSDTRF